MYIIHTRAQMPSLAWKAVLTLKLRLPCDFGLDVAYDFVNMRAIV